MQSDFANANTEYAYNANGAMTKDLNKGISKIEYNLLNLPQQIDINSPLAVATNRYSYSADGVKLRVGKTYNSGIGEAPIEIAVMFSEGGESKPASYSTVTSTTDYVGNKIFENNLLDRILVDGGYIKGGVYYFYETDHLGSNRLTVSQTGAASDRSDYFPYGMQMAHNDPDKGMAMARDDGSAKTSFKFSGKELDVMHGLNLYDFSARSHDPTLGRFTTVDPLAEKYYSISPYVYCGNNPLRFIDPTGMDWYESKEGKVMWINESDKDMKKQVDGWKHIGDTYMGFTVKTYQAYDATDGSSRSSIEISYKSPNGDKTEGWVQTVKTNAPKEGEDPHSVDPPKGSHDNFPYYDSKAVTERNRFLSELDGYDIYFSDGATRLKERGNFYFNAELSLIKKQTLGQTLGNTTFLGVNYLRKSLLGLKDVNVISPVATFQWGFYRQNGITHLLPIVLTNPSAFQSNAIGQIKQ